MKQVFATAAMAGATSALSMYDEFHKMMMGQSYRQRDGADDPDSYQVMASTLDDGFYPLADYAPETGVQTKEDFMWAIEIQSIVNEDSGESIMILTNYLTGKILHTDVIEFDITFRSKTEIAAGSNATLGPLGFDEMTCKLQNDTRNRDFWIVVVEDRYRLNATPTVSTIDNVTTKTNGGRDWYIEDDDVDLDYHLCVPPDNQENWGQLTPSYFACKLIRCEARRNF